MLRWAREAVQGSPTGVGVAAIRYVGRHGGPGDVALLERVSAHGPGAEGDAARAAIASIERTVPAPEPDAASEACVPLAEAESLASSCRIADRARAGVSRIVAGAVGPDESLAILDRATSRGWDLAAAVTVALVAAEHGSLRDIRPMGAVATWQDLGNLAREASLLWRGPTAGRLGEVLHAGGDVRLFRVLMGLAVACPPRGALLERDTLTAPPAWRAVEHHAAKLRNESPARG